MRSGTGWGTVGSKACAWARNDGRGGSSSWLTALSSAGA